VGIRQGTEAGLSHHRTRKREKTISTFLVWKAGTTLILVALEEPKEGWKGKKEDDENDKRKT
jgi:hypothetical protein